MEEPLRHILVDQVRRYPLLQMTDLYKLLHQASLGSEHAVKDEAGVRAWLERELATMGAGPDEPLLDDISPTGEIVRLHLRPYVEAGGEPEKLLVAFLRTAREYRGSVERLRRYWEIATEMAFDGLLPFPPDRMGEFLQRLEQQGFPVLHHSQVYEELYRPAYRIIARTFLLAGIRP